jgi:hypothetical protein
MAADLYRRILASDWHLLHPHVRELHEAGATGTFDVQRGTSPAIRLLLLFVRVPPQGKSLPTHLTIKATHGGEDWTRRFGRVVIISSLSEHAGSLLEQFGLFEVRFHLQPVDGGLRHEQVGFGLRLGPLRISLPLGIAPRIEGREEVREDPDYVHISVSVQVPLLGSLVSYEGDVKADAL